jgi:hypothetical protein
MIPRNNNNNNNNTSSQQRTSRALWNAAPHSYTATLRAMLYELQPIRWQTIEFQKTSWLLLTVNDACSIVRQIAVWLVNGTVWIVGSLLRLLRSTSRKHIFVLVGITVYYFVVRLLHEWLEAGPVVLILTALILIFTVGLQDAPVAGQGQRQLSAYHIFNRGMERMMGTMDAEHLLQQYVGGGGMGMGMPILQRNHRHEELVVIEEDDDDDENERDDPQHDNDNNNHQMARHHHHRRSRKKSRGDQRREIQRQRDAAMALGLDQEEDPVVLQRLIDEQLAMQEQQR